MFLADGNGSFTKVHCVAWCSAAAALNPVVHVRAATSLHSPRAPLSTTATTCTHTQAMGLELDASGFGLGTRSQRYAMVVEDGVVSCAKSWVLPLH